MASVPQCRLSDPCCAQAATQMTHNGHSYPKTRMILTGVRPAKTTENPHSRLHQLAASYVGQQSKSIEQVGRQPMGNHQHREPGQIHGSVQKDADAARDKMQGQIKPLALQRSDSARIEQIMRGNLVEFTAQVGQYSSPARVLDALDDAIAEDVSLMVLGAKRFGINLIDRESLKVGENVFIHKSVPDGWWDAYLDLSKQAYAPIITMARHCLAPFTWTECLRMFEPVGIDRWAHELGLKYGMRDGLTCPVGARWVVAYWSRKVLSNTLSPQLRALLSMAANFAAIRLEQVVGPDPQRIGKQMSLTPRELAVLRLASNGNRTRRIAQLLGLGEETVRSHLKKAQTKLGAKDRLHAVAEALRHQLIP
jgi:DNA-binding CsgD family transcriptional regulator